MLGCAYNLKEKQHMTTPHHIPLHDFKIGNDQPFVQIAGPCQLECRDHAFDMAGALKEMAQKLGIPLIYKSSYDKANRTSLKAQRGLGLVQSMAVFDELRKKT